MSQFDKAKELVKDIGDIDGDMAAWLIAIIAGDHDIKVAWYDRSTVEHDMSYVFNDAEWERFEATYEWRNLSEYMNDGASNAVHFAVSDNDILEGN